jgi:hypothetical protein
MLSKTDIDNLRNNWNNLKNVAYKMNMNTTVDSVNDSINNDLNDASNNINISSTYTYQGCYYDRSNDRKIPNYLGKVDGITSCYNLAKSEYSLFGLQNYGECWVGNDINKATSYGKCSNRGKGSCNNMLGCSMKNQVYTIDRNICMNSCVDYYNRAKNTYEDTYNKVYSSIQNQASQIKDNVNTIVTKANSAVIIDTSANNIAIQPATKTDINTNLIQARGLSNANNDLNTYNRSINTSDINSYYTSVNTLNNDITNLTQISNSNKQTADDLLLTATQEKTLQDMIDRQNEFNLNVNSFIKSYTQDLQTTTSKFVKFISKLTNKENYAKNSLNTPLYKAPIPSINGNIDYKTADEKKMEIINNTNGGYEFINFTIDAVVSHPSKCVGITEYAKTPNINMSPLDNNSHTFSSCKIASKLANKPYYALVKPQGDTATGYQCYVSNDAPQDNVSTNDYAIIWQVGPATGNPAVSNFSLDACGNFIINCVDNTKINISNINNDLYKGCGFYLQLTDNGNIEIHSYGCTNQKIPEIAWQSFLIPDVKTKLYNTLLRGGPIKNPNWSGMNDKLTAQQPSNTTLVSPDGYYKLEITPDGNLQLKTTTYACKYTDITYGDTEISNTKFLYTDLANSGGEQSYYVYANDKNLPSINTPYYSTNSLGVKTIQPIDLNNPLLTKTNEYDVYTGYSFSSDPAQIQNMSTPVVSEEDCKTKCNNDPTCNYAYTYNNTQCSTGNKNIPDFIPNNKSKLYIRKKTMNMQNNPGKVPPNFENKNNALSYSDYNIQSPLSASFFPGYPSNPVFQQYNKIAQDTVFGTKPSGNEGFNNHGYYDPPVDSCSQPNEMGCQNTILQGQINPLNQIAQDFQNQTNNMKINDNVINNKITYHNHMYNTLNNNNKYDFNGNQPFTMEDNSIQNTMHQDTKQLLLQENNFYIAGSILTATLLITGIYLAR